MRIGFLGGSFDPVHRGHIQLAKAALKQLKLDKVYLVPAKQSPHKVKKPAPPALRLRMLSLALKSQKRLRVAKWELQRRGPSYTVSTLRFYKKRHPSDIIFLIMGSDSFRKFSSWKNYKEIAKLSTLVVGIRPGSTKFKISGKLSERVVILKGVFPNISSTQIRSKGLYGARPGH